LNQVSNQVLQEISESCKISVQRKQELGCALEQVNHCIQTRRSVEDMFHSSHVLWSIKQSISFGFHFFHTQWFWIDFLVYSPRSCS
jgi:hypothetical protein